jgi:hypothetical protein
MDAGNGKAETWLINFTKALRAQLPSGQYILTHAREYLPAHVITLADIPFSRRTLVHTYKICWWRLPQGSQRSRQSH